MKCLGLAVLLGLALSAQTREIAVTIDDLPVVTRNRSIDHARWITKSILDTLTAEKVPATAFVNEAKLQIDGERDARVDLLRMWRAAGVELGNHTYSHRDYNDLTLEQFSDELIRGEVVLRTLNGGQPVRYYRMPYTHQGQTLAKRDGLVSFATARGYRHAPYTVEDQDYLFSAAWETAMTRGDKALAERVQQAYIDEMLIALDFFEPLTEQLFHRPIKHILLIHANEINARCLSRLIILFRQRGYRFVSLDEALTDPAYLTTDGYVGTNGISWLHRWAISLGRPSRLKDEPDPPKWVDDLSKP